MAATEPPAGADDPPGDRLAGDPLDWAELPHPVRQRLAALAAAALPTLTPADLPPPVRPVARFAPGKRARLGGPVLVGALRDSAAFRAAVIAALREHRPGELAAADPVSAAAAGVLLGDTDAAERVAELARRAGDDRLRAERDAARTRADRLAADVDRLRRDLAAVREADRHIAATGDVERLRGRLRDQGARLRVALDELARATSGRDVEVDGLHRALAAAEAERDRERERAAAAGRQAARAVAKADAARHTAREARQADEVRLALLLDTLSGAVTGLRRELALGADASARSAPRPADLVSGAGPPAAATGRVDDPAALDRLLALPSVHLVVDGYNVTKSGYPDLTLSAQRDRLAAALGALAARTGAEVTIVFDGAAVVAAPAGGPRGVRVLFSDPGVLADDVIRAIVAAEPAGRPVVVVTSDRAVADSVRRGGAHPVPSAVLLTRLSRI